MASGVLLETERLRLRRFTRDDVADLIALNADPEVTYFIDGGRSMSRDQARAAIDRYVAEYDRVPGRGVFAVIECASGDFIGWAALHPADGRPDDELELGYRLRQASWGHGYATEVSVALVEHAFTETPARVVFAQTMTVNTRSRRVMGKAGLVHVRTWHQEWPDSDPIEGSEHGDVEYAITRQAWLASMEPKVVQSG